jgi:hypothetical protein
LIAVFIGTLAVFLISCAALTLGQWFGRAPIEGRCVPRGDDGCGAPECCRRRPEEPQT